MAYGWHCCSARFALATSGGPASEAGARISSGATLSLPSGLNATRTRISTPSGTPSGVDQHLLTCVLNASITSAVRFDFPSLGGAIKLTAVSVCKFIIQASRAAVAARSSSCTVSVGSGVFLSLVLLLLVSLVLVSLVLVSSLLGCSGLGFCLDSCGFGGSCLASRGASCGCRSSTMIGCASAGSNGLPPCASTSHSTMAA